MVDFRKFSYCGFAKLSCKKFGLLYRPYWSVWKCQGITVYHFQVSSIRNSKFHSGNQFKYLFVITMVEMECNFAWPLPAEMLFDICFPLHFGLPHQRGFTLTMLCSFRLEILRDVWSKCSDAKALTTFWIWNLSNSEFQVHVSLSL